MANLAWFGYDSVTGTSPNNDARSTVTIRGSGSNISGGSSLQLKHLWATGGSEYLARLTMNGTNVSDIPSANGGVNSALQLFTQTTNPIQLGTNNTARVFVDGSSGNVGIGTSAPGLTFDAYGAAGYPASSGSAQTGIARFEAANYNVLDIGQANAAPWGLWLQGTHRAALGTTYPLLLNPNGGNVGIGTTAPATALDVQGQIRSLVYNAAAGTTFDWNNSNTQYTTATCGAFTFSNMKDGGIYTLIVKSTTQGTCAFTQAGLTFRSQTSLTTASGSYTIFNIIVAGADAFVTIRRGF